MPRKIASSIYSSFSAIHPLIVKRIANTLKG